MKTAHQPHVKKVLVSDELTTPEARAERLRRVRNMANLNRQEMCDTVLNINTYKGWEIARYGGLPVDGAEKVVKRVLQEGVICSTDWLLLGRGHDPYVLPKESMSTDLVKQHDLQPKDLVIKEIMVFQSFFPTAFFCEIEDDGMAPTYQQGDFVAGIRKFGNDIIAITNENCIVQTHDGKTFVRYVRATENRNKFMLICTNINTSVQNPIMQDVVIEFASQIVRHYRIIKD